MTPYGASHMSAPVLTAG